MNVLHAFTTLSNEAFDHRMFLRVSFDPPTRGRIFFSSWRNPPPPPSGPGPPHYRGFTITLRRTTFERTPLDE